MKKLKVFSISAILIAICCSFLFSASVSAASKKRNKFDHKPSGNIYYYDENGHTVKGLVTIRGKKYYFNEELRKSYAQKGLERAKLFSWKKCAEQMINQFKINNYSISTSAR